MSKETISQNLLNDCEKEPLAFSGLIQPHGGLLFLSKATGTFTFGSENLESFIGESCDDLLGEDGEAWIEEMLPDLDGLPSGAGNRAYLPNALDLGEGEINVLISPTSEGWMIEFEFAQEGEENVSAPVIPPINTDNPLDISHIHQAVVDGLAEITNYDRVMLYQFLPDWSGEVLAESVLRSSGTYLSLRFPASDIPAIARGLYAQAPYRYIPLATNDTVNIVGRGQEGQTLDLTWSDLRSVSPVHIQYLTNMNVHASFSISIMVGGKLWGLIASHNDAPGPISLRARLACTVLISEFVARVEAQRVIQKKMIAEQLGSKIGAVLQSASSSEELAQAIIELASNLKEQIDFNDCVIGIDDYSTSLNGATDQTLAKRLISLNDDTSFESITASDSLPEEFESKPQAVAAGIAGYASFRVRATKANNALVTVVLTRAEESGEVAWAGNPQKPVEVSESGGIKLSPRESFEKWVQVRQGMSRTWNEDDLFVLGLLREQLSAALQ